MTRRGGTQTDLESAIYNPGLLTREALKRSFVARKQTLATLDAELRAVHTGTGGQQHRLFVGPRGFGKTTLLLRLHYLVEDDAELAAHWQPLSFVEEKYGIGDLAGFWLEVLRELPSGKDGFPDSTVERLRKRYPTDSDRLADAAYATLKQWALTHKRQVLLLIDNLNEVFYHIQDLRQLHQLRACLMEAPWMRLIGFSHTHFEQLDDTRGPFYEFFEVERLQTLSLEETEEILVHWSEQDKRPDVHRRMVMREGRIKNLHILTGGNPRLVAVIYELIKEGPLNSTFEDVQKLVDRMTPYFKAQIDGLPPQSRRVIDALARHWAPVPTKTLKEDLRLPGNQVSAQLSRLKRDGWILQLEAEGQAAHYQVADRFYNIFYLIRYSRSAVDRLKGFVHFLRVLFEEVRDQQPSSEQLAFLERALEHVPADPDLVYAWTKLVLNEIQPSPLDQVEARVNTAFAAKPDATQARELRALLQLHRGRWREALGVLDALLGEPGVLEAHENAWMDLSMSLGAWGKPGEVATVLIEQGLEERWRPLVLALQLVEDSRHAAARMTVPQEMWTVALELKETMLGRRAKRALFLRPARA